MRCCPFCMWYLFLSIALLIVLESIANFIDLPFFTVKAILEMKNSSLPFSNLVMCPLICKFVRPSF